MAKKIIHPTTAPIAALPPDGLTVLTDEATLNDVWKTLGIKIEGKQVSFAAFASRLTDFTTAFGPAKRSLPLIAPAFQALRAKFKDEEGFTDRRFFACFDQTFLEEKWNGTHKNAKGKDVANLYQHPAWESYRNLLRWRAPKPRTGEILTPKKLAEKAAPYLRKMLVPKVVFATFLHFMLLVGKKEPTIYKIWNETFPDRGQKVPDKKKEAA